MIRYSDVIIICYNNIKTLIDECKNDDLWRSLDKLDITCQATMADPWQASSKAKHRAIAMAITDITNRNKASPRYLKRLSSRKEFLLIFPKATTILETSFLKKGVF